MSAISIEPIVAILLQAVIGFVLWSLKGTLAELREDIKALRQTIYTDTVRRAEFNESKHNIEDLHNKVNSLTVKCAKHHG